MKEYLIVGLGNPGKNYEKTRHNIGFEIVKKYAKRNGSTFKEEVKFNGHIAQVCTDDARIYLLMPTTYMNRSGQSVLKCKNYFKIDLSKILVIMDDANIPFGEMRIKTDSGSGGHHGLDDIEQHLTKNYARLRIGVGKKEEDLASFVLKKFNNNEQKLLPDIIDRAIQGIDLWMEEGMDAAMNRINMRISKKQNEDL